MSLTLTRKADEQIYITPKGGPEIIITVKRVSSGRVRIGIDAPDDCHILRGELEKLPEHGRNQVVATK